MDPARLPAFPSTVRAVLFDFDFTVVDAGAAICIAFRKALGCHHMTDSAIRSLVGMTLHDMFHCVRPDASSSDLDKLIEQYRSEFLPLCIEHSRLEPGAREVIPRLARTAKVGLVTSRLTDGAVRMLTAHDLLQPFEVLIGLEHVTHPKPDAEPVLLALERLGCLPENAVMVGDTTQDIGAGIAAGAGAIGVTTGPCDRSQLLAAGAHYVVDSLWELEPLLGFVPTDDGLGNIQRSR